MRQSASELSLSDPEGLSLEAYGALADSFRWPGWSTGSLVTAVCDFCMKACLSATIIDEMSMFVGRAYVGDMF